MRNSLCQKYDLKLHAVRCEQNLNSIIESYEVLAVPSFENIFALVMGVSKHEPLTRIPESLTLSCLSSQKHRMKGNHYCVALLFPQLPVTARCSDTITKKCTATTELGVQKICADCSGLHMFFKNISRFSLAGPQNMQDFDIDTRFPALSTDPAIRPWDESFIMGIKLAQLQSQIYDRLYSTAALKATGCERRQCVQQIATTMQEWEVELRQVMIPPLSPSELMDCQ